MRRSIDRLRWRGTKLHSDLPIIRLDGAAVFHGFGKLLNLTFLLAGLHQLNLGRLMFTDRL